MSDINEIKTPAIIEELRAKQDVCRLKIGNRRELYPHKLVRKVSYNIFIEYGSDIVALEVAAAQDNGPIRNRLFHDPLLFDQYDDAFVLWQTFKIYVYEHYIHEVRAFMKNHGEWDETLFILGAR